MGYNVKIQAEEVEYKIVGCDHWIDSWCYSNFIESSNYQSALLLLSQLDGMIDIYVQVVVHDKAQC